jgi:hypothetical protein
VSSSSDLRSWSRSAAAGTLSMAMMVVFALGANTLVPLTG